MEIAAVVALVTAVLALVAVAVLARAVRVARRRHSEQLDTVLLELEELRRTREPERVVAPHAGGRPEQAEFLITDVGEPHPEPTVADRVVLSATLGEPLVKAVAFGHGLRRALSPRARNRILFEMRREVRRARKQRRRDMKQAWRRSRSEEPTG